MTTTHTSTDWDTDSDTDTAPYGLVLPHDAPQEAWLAARREQLRAAIEADTLRHTPDQQGGAEPVEAEIVKAES